MKETLWWLTGVWNPSKLQTMHQRLLSTSRGHMTVKRSADQALLLRDLHSTKIFFWQCITSISLSGEQTWRNTKNPSSSQWAPRELTTLAERSLQLDQVWSSSRRQMESTSGTLLTRHTNRVSSSTSPRVRSCIANSSTSNMQTTSNTWLTVTKIAEQCSSMRCLKTSETASPERKIPLRTSGTRKSRSVISSWISAPIS